MTNLNHRRQAFIFVLITFAISWIEEYFIIRGDGIQNTARAFALMWTPGLVGIFCSWIFDRNFKSLAFKRPDLKSIAAAYFIPAVTAAFIIALLVLFNLAEFQVQPTLIQKKGSLGMALFAALVVAPTVGMIVSIISGLGEEIGWRGFLHSKLDSFSAPKRYLITGLIWSAWHWPLIIFGDYATSDRPWLNVIFFTIGVTSISFLMGYLRDRSKSVFPAALVHASHNMWILGISPAFFKAGPLTPYFAGESGFFCALIYSSMALYIFKFKLAEKINLS